jgi:hypothetical protein
MLQINDAVKGRVWEAGAAPRSGAVGVGGGTQTHGEDRR